MKDSFGAGVPQGKRRIKGARFKKGLALRRLTGVVLQERQIPVKDKFKHELPATQ
jgi:hypothetical protein